MSGYSIQHGVSGGGDKYRNYTGYHTDTDYTYEAGEQGEMEMDDDETVDYNEPEEIDDDETVDYNEPAEMEFETDTESDDWGDTVEV